MEEDEDEDAEGGGQGHWCDDDDELLGCPSAPTVGGSESVLPQFALLSWNSTVDDIAAIADSDGEEEACESELGEEGNGDGESRDDEHSRQSSAHAVLRLSHSDLYRGVLMVRPPVVLAMPASSAMAGDVVARPNLNWVRRRGNRGGGERERFIRGFGFEVASSSSPSSSFLLRRRGSRFSAAGVGSGLGNADDEDVDDVDDVDDQREFGTGTKGVVGGLGAKVASECESFSLTRPSETAARAEEPVNEVDMMNGWKLYSAMYAKLAFLKSKDTQGLLLT